MLNTLFLMQQKFNIEVFGNLSQNANKDVRWATKLLKYMKRMWRIKLDYVKGIFELAFVLLYGTLNGGVLHVWISFSRNLLSHSWLVYKASTIQKAIVTEITMNCHIISPRSVLNMTFSRLFLDMAHGRNKIDSSHLFCHNFVF